MEDDKNLTKECLEKHGIDLVNFNLTIKANKEFAPNFLIKIF